MIFKDKVAFLCYITSYENYGPIKVQFHGSVELSINPIESSKQLPENIYNTLYDIIWYHFFDTTELLGYSNYNISYSEFTLKNNNGELEMVDSYYNSSHQSEKNEMIEQIKELLYEVLQRDYMLVIHISGNYRKIQDIEIISYYLGNYDHDEIESEIYDELLKTKILQSLRSWSKIFSYESSCGEYDFDEFELDFSISSYPNHDTWCNFYEVSKSELIDLSVLDINSSEIELI